MVTLKVFLKYHTTSVLWDYEITKVKPKTIALRAKTGKRQASIVIQTRISQVNLSAFSQFTELLIVYQINEENVKVSQ